MRQHARSAGISRRKAWLRHGRRRHLESVGTYPELRAAFNSGQPKVSVLFSGIPLNEDVWKRLMAFAALPEAQPLSSSKKRSLEETIGSFRRSGADLYPQDKERLLDQRRTRQGDNEVFRERPGRDQRLRINHRQRGRAGGPTRISR